MPSDNNDLSVKRRCLSNNKKGIKSLFETYRLPVKKGVYITIKKSVIYGGNTHNGFPFVTRLLYHIM